jgi:hypothetical protein
MPRRINDVADDLVKLYGERFGGKLRGRYKISKDNLAYLATRSNLQVEGFLDPLKEEMFDRGFTFNRSDDSQKRTYFVVIKNDIFENYREVPIRLVRQYLQASEEEAED